MKAIDRKVIAYRPNDDIRGMIEKLMKPSDDKSNQSFLSRIIQERYDRDFPEVAPDLPSS